MRSVVRVSWGEQPHVWSKQVPVPPTHSADLGTEAPSRPPRREPQLLSDEMLYLFAESWRLSRDGPQM